MIYWFTGLSGSGKSSIAQEIKRIYSGFVWLDGDDIRQGLNKDLGFSVEDRKENLRRVIEVCKLFAYEGKTMLCTFITPFEVERQKIKNLLNAKIIYLKCDIKECIKRDVKGLYKNKTKNMSGIESPYEIPKIYDLCLDTVKESKFESVRNMLKFVNEVEFK